MPEPLAAPRQLLSQPHVRPSMCQARQPLLIGSSWESRRERQLLPSRPFLRVTGKESSLVDCVSAQSRFLQPH